ncbi:MAG: response regulator [Proteobacteria bacterium]|nr:response regulator [Pseudomonadota bacterium]
MRNHILVVEDEHAIAEVLVAYARKDGFTTHHIDRGLVVLPYIRLHGAALVLLDLMLPDCTGIDVCKSLRRFSDTPVIMVTAKVSEIDRLLGLELGADDYICKPFSAREVMARVKAVLRRSRPETGETVTAGKLILYPGLYDVYYHGAELELTPKELQILLLLATKRNHVISSASIMELIYEYSQSLSDRIVDSHIKNIRRKMMRVSEEVDPIAGVYGVGYKLRLG